MDGNILSRAFPEVSFLLISLLLGHPATAGIKGTRYSGTGGVCTHRKGNDLRTAVPTLEKLFCILRLEKTRNGQ